MEPKWGPWTDSGEEGSQEAKTQISHSIWEVILETVGPMFRGYFLMFFSKASFSLLGRLLGAQGAQKAPKTEPKWSQRHAWRHLVGSARTMVFTVPEAYGEVSGRLREATFSRPRLQTLFGGVLGSTCADFRRFWVPFGVPGSSSSEAKW